MIYNEKIKQAILISYKAHEGQYDKGGYPYCFHPYHLAEMLETEDEIIVALLHDVMEDHPETCSWKYLEETFGKDVAEALHLLTHNEKVPYMDYVKEIAKNPIARRVKMADLLHNMDATRTNGQLPYKLDLYKEAYRYLENYR